MTAPSGCAGPSPDGIGQAGWDVVVAVNGYGCGKAPADDVGAPGGPPPRARRDRPGKVVPVQGEVRWSCYAG